MIDDISVKKEKKFLNLKRIVYFVLGILQVFVALHFVFKILGAKSDTYFQIRSNTRV